MTKPFIALAVFVATRISIPIFFFFNDTATTEIYTLSLHDALPISSTRAILWIDGLASERPAANCRAKMRLNGDPAGKFPREVFLPAARCTSALRGRSDSTRQIGLAYWELRIPRCESRTSLRNDLRMRG